MNTVSSWWILQNFKGALRCLKQNVFVMLCDHTLLKPLWVFQFSWQIHSIVEHYVEWKTDYECESKEDLVVWSYLILSTLTLCPVPTKTGSLNLSFPAFVSLLQYSLVYPVHHSVTFPSHCLSPVLQLSNDNPRCGLINTLWPNYWTQASLRGSSLEIHV